ncbi:hypothetical protein E3E14_05755 [Streptomyces sp. ICN441]|nr:hypothetical protein E3E14_05755 [Streptomyces sp. ICN441]
MSGRLPAAVAAREPDPAPPFTSVPRNSNSGSGPGQPPAGRLRRAPRGAEGSRGEPAVPDGSRPGPTEAGEAWPGA